MALEALKRNGHNLGLGEFPTEGMYDIPVIQPARLPERADWLPFNAALSAKSPQKKSVHFFIDDYLFQRVWNDPKRYAALLHGFHAVMSPDFSLFTDYPIAAQIYNHYRKHLLAAYWQSLGLIVIPSVCWSDRGSYDWCFDGEPAGGTVAVSSVGTQKSPDARKLFLDGYNEMLVRLKPDKIIFFGNAPDGCEGNIEHHPPYYARVAQTLDKQAVQR